MSIPFWHPCAFIAATQLFTRFKSQVIAIKPFLSNPPLGKPLSGIPFLIAIAMVVHTGDKKRPSSVRQGYLSS